MSLLSVHSLNYRYPSGKSLAFPDFSCNPGSNLLIHGMSGCGKTTLLHLLSGILTPSHGEVRMGDVLMSAMASAEKDRFRGQHIGMIFQKHFFIEGISVLENLKAARRFAGNDDDHAYLHKLLDDLAIGHLSGKKAAQLSEGEQQRFSIARALANRPSWVLADEPTSGLDDVNCASFTALMRLAVEEKPVSWIVASHDNRLKDHFNHVYHL